MAEVVALPGCDRVATPDQRDADIETALARLRVVIEQEGLDSLALVYTTKQRYMRAIYTGMISDNIASLAKAQHEILTAFCKGT